MPAPGTRSLVLAAFAWNFIGVGAYSMVGPVRGALLVSGFGPDVLPWTYMAGALLTGAVVWIYGRFTCMPRGRLIGSCLAILAVTALGGALALVRTPSPALSFAYLLWTDVFGIMSVTLFWTYANDVFRPEEAKRWFGVIASASPIGALAGAWAVKAFVAQRGPAAMLVAAAAVFCLVLPVFLLLERLAAGSGRGRAVDAPCGALPPPRPVAQAIAASPYLLFLTVIVGLERLVPDVNNYLFGVEAARAYAGDSRGMAMLYAEVNWWSSLVSFAASMLLVGPALRRLGAGGSLMLVGAVNLALFAAYPFAPSLGLVSAFSGLDAVARYTFFKTAKETTYSIMERDVIYRVKAFVEMFVYRLARGVGGFLLLLAAWWNGGEGAALVGLPLAAAWIYASWRVGREHARAESAHAARG